MRNVPAKFDLMGRSYVVTPLPAERKEEVDGEHSYAEATVWVNTDLTPQHRMATFCHEFTHAQLEAAERIDLSSDEALVGVLGNLLHQFLKTYRGKLTLQCILSAT